MKGRKKMNPNTFHVVDHPLIKHKLSIMREKDTGSKDFRQLLSEIAMLMCYEITRDIPVVDVEIETPVSKMIAQKVEGKKLAIVPILRAGLGMVDGILTLVPVAKVGHTKAPRTLRPLPLLRFAVSATGGAHLCSIQYYLRFWPSSCRTSLAVSALRIMRYCLWL